MFSWLAKRILSGHMPGGSMGFRVQEADGSEFAVLTQGDSMEMYRGKKVISSFSLSTETALRLAWWLIWTWWAKATLFGIRKRMWTWAFRHRLDQRKRELSERTASRAAASR